MFASIKALNPGRSPSDALTVLRHVRRTKALEDEARIEMTRLMRANAGLSFTMVGQPRGPRRRSLATTISLESASSSAATLSASSSVAVVDDVVSSSPSSSSSTTTTTLASSSSSASSLSSSSSPSSSQGQLSPRSLRYMDALVKLYNEDKWDDVLALSAEDFNAETSADDENPEHDEVAESNARQREDADCDEGDDGDDDNDDDYE